MENSLTNNSLRELAGSNYVLAPNVTDITGWPVTDQSHKHIGTVEELLFEPQEGRARYLVVALTNTGDDLGKKVVIPVGLAERNTADQSIILPEVSNEQIYQLPAYQGVAALTEERELSIRRILEGHSDAPYEHPQFYAHQHFNEDRFYQTTNLADETAEASDARAEHASRIIARLDHHDELNDEQAGQQPDNESDQKEMAIDTSDNIIDTLNRLIEINNDRIEGFEKAAQDLEDDDDLISILNKLAGESRQNVVELTDIVQRYDGEPAEGTSTSGALHRAWLNVKAVFTGGDLKAVLDECERGEDAIKSAYQSALVNADELNPAVVQVLQNQQIAINQGHDLIESLRDQVSDEKYGEDEVDPDTDGAEKVSDSLYSNETTAAEPFFEGDEREYKHQTAYLPEPENNEQEEAYEEDHATATVNSKLMEFFVDELKDLLWAERKLVNTLPDMAEAATSQQLKIAFTNHLKETEVHVTRLEQIFGILGLEPDTTKCDAMAGILDEGDDIISNTEEGTAQRDVGLIFAGQKAEHYEIASYGGMISLAKTLGYYDIAEMLVLTIDEEKSADALLTEIAENHVNYEASREESDL